MGYLNVVDPIELARLLWPNVYFYSQQREVIYSVVENDETYVPAGNQLGKDFVAAFICLWFFLSRNPVRIVTTSAKDDHLRVLWGEIGRFIDTAAYPLDFRKGGPLLIHHQDIRKVVNGDRDAISYLVGMVAGPDSIAAMQGHHANPADVRLANDGVPRTLFVSDECSSVDSQYYVMASTWMKRALLIGNTWECDNFWKHHCEAGDVEREGKPGYHRRVIRITAEDSPNVKLARAQEESGREPTGEVIVPGVVTWDDYRRKLKLYDEIQQAVSLRAEFYKGQGVMMFPGAWTAWAMKRAWDLGLKRGTRRAAEAAGIDPGEGGDKTAFCSGDRLGVIEMTSEKTPDTNEILGKAVAFLRRNGFTEQRCDRVMIDQGGGGKQLADRLRSVGWEDVQTVPFGAAVTTELKRGKTLFDERFEVHEGRYTFKNRRAQLFGEARQLLDPDLGGGYGIPAKYRELFTQMRPIPLRYDGEGRMVVPPKRKKDAQDRQVTLEGLIGHSPDELDSFVLMVHGLLYESQVVTAGAAW